jgi:hypothetical protein
MQILTTILSLSALGSLPPRSYIRWILTTRTKDVSVTHAKGCAITGDGAWSWGDAVTAAREADVAVLFMGSSSKV